MKYFNINASYSILLTLFCSCLLFFSFLFSSSSSSFFTYPNSVLAALEMERFKSKSLDMSSMTSAGATSAETTAATLDNLMSHDQATGESKSLERPWHGAEGVHFYMLAQRQLYDGEIEAAMITAVRCGQYDDVLGTKEASSIIALTSFYNKHFGTCSKAFIQLECQKGLPQKELDEYIGLGVDIFSRHPPQDPDSKALPFLDVGRPAW